ncbi:penicillin-binding protein 2 [Facklamia sp. DSM 111018]|uniref:Penicillin-binding protein 2 n=1 Tax=Facklamia lactis TaxID=2749967 RepID=A0ABS0LNZ7_9LACT|nr:penicillin-binding protein 2 [Facklamia lactis]MBG9980071.1 penicillin-binding protein 2 [Facklamia lactis]MBG9985873.1 penicillin-binding protein 2 [Facklamia lactis]
MPKSNYQLKKKKNRSHIPRRLNLLFFVAFLAFTALFVRLGFLQLYRGETFTGMVQRTESTLSTGSVPRGMIYDSQGEIVVGNQPQRAILYTRDRDSQITGEKLVEIATQLASLIEMPTQGVTKLDMQDYFVVTNMNTIRSRLSEEELLLSGPEAYQAQLSKVQDADLDFSEAELEVIAIYKRMASAYALSTVSVKNKNVSQEEIARVSENLADLPGIQIGTDWQRTYPKGEMFRSILGQVSTEERGIPSEDAKDLLSKGYAMNDRIGISYLEKQYETVLRGTKSIHNIVTDAKDDILQNKEIYQGSKGNNLVLTINTDFQAKLDKIVEDNLKDMGENQGLNDRVYVVALNPKNGEVIGVAGKRFAYNEDKDAYNYEEIQDDALGAINTSYGMGSSVKPAMVAMGYKEGVISLTDNVLTDEPLKFQASQEKSSVFNRSGKMDINDIQALQMSSNIYMIKLAMMIGGQFNYEEEGRLNINPDTISMLRKDFSEFGLGTRTGIDLPNESEGFTPASEQLVSALDLSYGQFDLYTPLQMAQYVSTIANGGKRYSPRLVKEIRGTDSDGKLGDVISTMPPKLLNVIDIDPAEMERIHEGMRQVSHTDQGTARYFFMNYPFEVGSKTGTTEAFYAGPIQYAQNDPVTNATYVGFAPYDDPEIAITVVVPYLDEKSWGRESTRIAHEVMNAYFESKAETRKTIQEYKKTAQVVE